MFTRTKGSAKRTLVAAVVTAMFAGLLALASPASANSPSSPTTNRIHGADRYATAVAIARNTLGAGNPTDGLVIVSGESTADALAAAVLTTANRPILLVQKDSIPESVTDFISDYKASMAGAAAPVVYVVGGTDAISAANYTALSTAITAAGDVTPPTFARLSGADRYATAKAVGDVTGITVAADHMILVSGESWADGVSAGVMSAEAGWPIVTSPKNGLNASVKASIDAYLALPSSVKQFKIIGGEAAISTDVENYLINTKGVAVANIRRIHGADRYATSAAVVGFLRASGAPFANLNANVMALASGESPWDALAASGWAATQNALIQLTPAAGGNASADGTATGLGALANAAAVTNAAAQGSTLYVLGGKAVVNDSARDSFQAAAKGSNLTATLSGCVEGATSITLTLSGALSANENTAAIADGTGFEALFKENNVAIAVGGDVDIAATASPYDSAAYTVTVTALSATDVIKFNGVVEDTDIDGAGGGTDFFERSIGAATCTVANDAVRPTVTMTAIAGAYATADDNGDGAVTVPKWIIRSNEPLDAPAMAAGDLTCGGTVSSAAPVAVAVDSKTWTITLGNGEADLDTAAGKLAAGIVCSMAATEFIDPGDLNPAAAVTATMAAHTLGTATVNAITCATANAQGVLTSGSLEITSVNNKAYEGAKANAWKMNVVNSRGLLSPTVNVDTTAKTITVTADTGYHTEADVAAVWASTNQTSAWSVGNTATVISATVVPATTTAGETDCTMNLNTSEPMALANAGVTIAVGGLNAGYISNIAVTGTADFAATDVDANLRVNHTIAFRTKATGLGSIAFANSDSGLSNMSGANYLQPVTFTVPS